MKNLLMLLTFSFMAICFLACDKPVDPQEPVDPELQKFLGTWMETFPCDSVNYPCLEFTFMDNYVMRKENNNTESAFSLLPNNQIDISGYSGPYNYNVNDSVLTLYIFYNQMGLSFDYKFKKQ